MKALPTPHELEHPLRHREELERIRIAARGRVGEAAEFALRYRPGAAEVVVRSERRGTFQQIRDHRRYVRDVDEFVRRVDGGDDRCDASVHGTVEERLRVTLLDAGAVEVGEDERGGEQPLGIVRVEHELQLFVAIPALARMRRARVRLGDARRLGEPVRVHRADQEQFTHGLRPRGLQGYTHQTRVERRLVVIDADGVDDRVDAGGRAPCSRTIAQIGADDVDAGIAGRQSDERVGGAADEAHAMIAAAQFGQGGGADRTGGAEDGDIHGDFSSRSPAAAAGQSKFNEQCLFCQCCSYFY
jgi:hypothetical protein